MRNGCLFSGFMGNKSERGTNKPLENREAICLFRVFSMHIPLTVPFQMTPRLISCDLDRDVYAIISFLELCCRLGIAFHSSFKEFAPLQWPGGVNSSPW